MAFLLAAERVDFAGAACNAVVPVSSIRTLASRRRAGATVRRSAAAPVMILGADAGRLPQASIDNIAR